MQQVTQAVEEFYAYLAQEKIVWVGVGFSGGLDSSVLLDSLVRFKPEVVSLQAIHVHHGLQSVADSWVGFCQEVCSSLGVDLKIHYAEVSQGASIEKQARKARYQAFREMEFAGAPADNNVQGVICLAHHQADNAETFVLNLMRGAGVAGLASIPQRRVLEDGSRLIYRPLLNVPYAVLQDYAAKYNLTWVEDPSNQDSKFNRNFLRNKVFPVLKSRWPLAEQKITQTAEFQREAQELLEELAAEDLVKVEHSFNKINYLDLADFSLARQKNILRFWLWKFHKKRLDSVSLDWVLHEAIPARVDAQPSRKLDGFKLRRFSRFVFYLDDLNKEFAFKIRSIEDFTLAKVAVDFAEFSQGFIDQRLALPDFARQEVVIRNIKPTDELNRKSLKKWFQQQEVPPWERALWPVLEIDSKLAAVIGYRVFADFKAKKLDQGLVLTRLGI